MGGREPGGGTWSGVGEHGCRAITVSESAAINAKPARSRLLRTEERPQFREEVANDGVLESQIVDTLVNLLT